MWVILLNNADWDCFPRLWLRRRSWRFKIHFTVNIMCFWQSYICSNKTAVSHSSTESEIISLDTGLRLDGLPALETMGSNCFCSLEMFLVFQVDQGNLRLMITNTTSLTIKSMWWKTLMLFLQISNLRVKEALLYVFEDNEAVIKMIIKGRSPTMRNVSRTHRVALDWLFDRINLDSKIQIKYIDTKNQLAYILTKGNFTRDEGNHLLNFVEH